MPANRSSLRGGNMGFDGVAPPAQPKTRRGLRLPKFELGDVSKKKALLYGTGVVALWGALTIDRSPAEFNIPFTEKQPPSPLDVTEWAFKQPANFVSWLDGRKSTQQSEQAAPITAVVEPTQTAETQPVVITDTTLPAFGSTLAPLPTIPVISAPETLPATTPVVESSPSAGLTSGPIVCSNTVTVTIAEGDYPLTAMARASGEPFNRIVSDQANQLWADTQNILNGGAVSEAIGTQFIGPDNCTGYTLLP